MKRFAFSALLLAFGIGHAVQSRASSEYSFPLLEYWARSSGEVVYAKSDPKTGELSVLCIEVESGSVSLPPEALSVLGGVDLSGTGVSRSCSHRADETWKVTSECTLSIRLAGEIDDQGKLIHFRTENGRLGEEASIGALRSSDFADTADRTYPVVFRSGQNCPSPSSASQ